MPASTHPIVNNLNATRFEFVNTVDTVGAPEIRKSVLLRSSNRSTRINAPARISLNILRETPDSNIYKLNNLPLAVLLEGKFSSNYANRILPALMNNPKIGFMKACTKENRMIVVADGDVIRNGVMRDGRIIPAGFDRYTGELFGNKDFILNCVNYLCDDAGLISIRSRQEKLRLLDDARIKSGRAGIQIKNVALPIAIMLLAGGILVYLRKRKFSKA